MKNEVHSLAGGADGEHGSRWSDWRGLQVVLYVSEACAILLRQCIHNRGIEAITNTRRR